MIKKFKGVKMKFRCIINKHDYKYIRLNKDIFGFRKIYICKDCGVIKTSHLDTPINLGKWILIYNK